MVTVLSVDRLVAKTVVGKLSPERRRWLSEHWQVCVGIPFSIFIVFLTFLIFVLTNVKM